MSLRPTRLPVTPAVTPLVRLALALLLAVGPSTSALAQSSPAGSASPPSQPAQKPQAAATPAPEAPRSVAVDASGGPSDLVARVQAAIDAWSKAAPGLTDLRVEPSAASTLGYATPALLGPDTLSLDLRVPGRSGVEVRLAGSAAHDHPMVLLHEVGVLLGLPEGGQGVMAFAVPSQDEPATPTAADVTALKTQRSFAPEDLNHDGAVDFYDLVLFGQAFGKQGVNLPADFNGDGRVDRQDLDLLERAYTFSPPSRTAPGAGTAPAGAGPANGASTSSPSSPPTSSPTPPTTPPASDGAGSSGGGSGSSTP